MTPEQACKQAIKWAGGAAEVARRTGVSIQAVEQWKRVPPRWCIVVSAMGECRISIFVMQPDVFSDLRTLARVMRRPKKMNGHAR
jgi:DNA-binding transcriptional regulator YdaS (Cro superfamily)